MIHSLFCKGCRALRLPLRSPVVAAWLFLVAIMIVIMIAVGGVTRLTRSGLSITEWNLVTGVIPPTDEAAWQAEFDKYKKIPQFQKVNSTMTLDSYKNIYWWEWIHRIVGRLLGLVTIAPLIVFLLRSEMPLRIIWRACLLVGLGLFQGIIGWWMVQSGLENNILVAPERLMTHLGMGLSVFVLALWFGLEALEGQSRSRGGPMKWRILTGVLFGLLCFQILLGALVAGNEAGLVYNDWPLMDGRFAPYVDWSTGIWSVFVHDQGMVQFMHRMNAYVLLIYVLVYMIMINRDCWDDQIKGLTHVLFGLLIAQAVLGIVVLRTNVSLLSALLHQFGGVTILGICTYLMWKVARADRDFK